MPDYDPHDTDMRIQMYIVLQIELPLKFKYFFNCCLIMYIMGAILLDYRSFCFVLFCDLLNAYRDLDVVC